MIDIDPKFGKPYDPRGKAGEVTAVNADDLVVEGSDGKLSILTSDDPDTLRLEFGNMSQIMKLKEFDKLKPGDFENGAVVDEIHDTLKAYEKGYTPLEGAVAMSLYAYNVSPAVRAFKLYEHFDGACMETAEMVELFLRRGEFWATELPMPTAKIYLEFALEKYGGQARERIQANLSGF